MTILMLSYRGKGMGQDSSLNCLLSCHRAWDIPPYLKDQVSNVTTQRVENEACKRIWFAEQLQCVI